MGRAFLAMILHSESLQRAVHSAVWDIGYTLVARPLGIRSIIVYMDMISVQVLEQNKGRIIYESRLWADQFCKQFSASTLVTLGLLLVIDTFRSSPDHTLLYSTTFLCINRKRKYLSGILGFLVLTIYSVKSDILN